MVQARTEQGTVSGVEVGGAVRFRGIPYAAAPFGPNRYRPPQPPAAWDGVRDTAEFGVGVPQARFDGDPFDGYYNPRRQGEDCLTLDVWTPDPATSGLPVLVWIHGGGFITGTGSAPAHDGHTFARDGVVLVGVNYRLGIEGFLHVEGSDPNRGLLDQVAALAWVRDNVAAFGGDPGNVTVFGESAGAMSVGALLAMPSARGLFHRAILQSGAGHHAITAATASRVAGYAAEKLGVDATADALAAFPWERLLEVQKSLSAEAATAPDPARWGEIAANGMVFEPVVDGEVLPQLPIEAVAGGASADVAIMVGSNRDEHRLFLVPAGTDRVATKPMLAAVATAYRLPDGALDAYRAGAPDASPGMLLAEVMSDWFFRIPAVRLAEAHGAHVYEFDWASSLLDGRLGACHALELGFVFDTLPTARGLTGPDAPQELADAMHWAWIAFATDGDPGWEPYGEQRTVQLPDGSTITLDGGTTLSLDYSPGTRRLWLTSGAAVFDVVRDETRPFVVSAGEGNTTALGTSFSVKHGVDDIAVDCLRGRIKVQCLANAELGDGEAIRYSSSGLGEKTLMDAEEAAAWRQGLLIFRDRPLAEVVADLNRHRKGKVVIAASALRSRRVSGVFHLERPDEVLAQLEDTLQVRPINLAGGIVLLR